MYLPSSRRDRVAEWPVLALLAERAGWKAANVRCVSGRQAPTNKWIAPDSVTENQKLRCARVIRVCPVPRYLSQPLPHIINTAAAATAAKTQSQLCQSRWCGQWLMATAPAAEPVAAHTHTHIFICQHPDLVGGVSVTRLNRKLPCTQIPVCRG